MRTTSAFLLMFQHFLSRLLPYPPPAWLWGPKPQASRHVQTLVLTALPSSLFSEVSPILTQTSSPDRLSADGFVPLGPASLRLNFNTTQRDLQSSRPSPPAGVAFGTLLTPHRDFGSLSQGTEAAHTLLGFLWSQAGVVTATRVMTIAQGSHGRPVRASIYCFPADLLGWQSPWGECCASDAAVPENLK